MKKLMLMAALVIIVALSGCGAKQSAPAATEKVAPTAAETAAPAATQAAATQAAVAETAAPAAQNNSASVSMDDAKATSLADAGLAESDVQFTKTVLDTDDGIQKYEIEFRCNGYEYDYDINAQTGAIMEKSKELIDND